MHAGIVDRFDSLWSSQFNAIPYSKVI